MKRSFKDRIIALGLSYKKEMLILLLINIGLIGGIIAIYMFLKEMTAFVIGGIALGVINYIYLSRYSSLETTREKEHIDELISLLSYFEIFITNRNNVYTAFRLLLPYCSSFMDDAITTLLNQIDLDKSVGPYINFAQKFSNNVVESLMLSIYQMVDNGENVEQLTEFNVTFSEFSKSFHEEETELKKKSLDTVNSLPLYGAGAITIILSMSIMTIIGDYVNVI